ncbi:hypothetical protein KQI65_07015 [bacterium]|nr:hypothetical protein [bacterium]
MKRYAALSLTAMTIILLSSCANLWISADAPDPCAAAAKASSHQSAASKPGDLPSPEYYNLEAWCENYREYQRLRLTHSAFKADSMMTAKHGESYLGPWTP